MAVSTFALVTLGRIKTELDIADADINTRRDAWIERTIEQVTRDFESSIGRGIIARDYRHDLDGTGRSTLFTPQYPILAIQTLIVDIERKFERTIDIIPATSRAINPSMDGAVQIYNQWGVFGEGNRNVRIFYHAGYALLAVNFGSTQFAFSEHTTGGTRYTVTIPPGEYDPITLGSIVASEMSGAGLNTYQLNYVTTTRKFKMIRTAGNAAATKLKVFANSGTKTFLPIIGFNTSADLTGATAYTGGTSVKPKVPFDLERAAVSMVVYHFDRSNYGAARRQIRSESIGDYSVSYTEKFPPEVDSVLAKYRGFYLD